MEHDETISAAENVQSLLERLPTICTRSMHCYLCKVELQSKMQQAKKIETSGKKYLDSLNNIAGDSNGMSLSCTVLEGEKAYICHTCCGSVWY